MLAIGVTFSFGISMILSIPVFRGLTLLGLGNIERREIGTNLSIPVFRGLTLLGSSNKHVQRPKRSTFNPRF